MRCSKIEGLLAGYVDGRLGEAEHDAVVRHLAACSACRESAEDARLARETLAALTSLRPPGSFAPRIKAAAREEMAQSYAASLFGPDLQMWLSSAALVLIVLSALNWYTTGLQGDYVAPASLTRSHQVVPPTRARMVAVAGRSGVRSRAAMALNRPHDAAPEPPSMLRVKTVKDLNALVAVAPPTAALAPKPPVPGGIGTHKPDKPVTVMLASTRPEAPPASAVEARLPEGPGAAEPHATYAAALASPEPRLDTAGPAAATATASPATDTSSPTSAVTLASLTSDRSLDWPSM